MSNFDFLKKNARFASLASAAEAAEKIYAIDAAACVFNCRRVLESAIRWMYDADAALDMPYNDSLKSMLDHKEFRDLVGDDLYKRMDYIRRAGNEAGHTDEAFSPDEAMLCLENLHAYLDYLAFCYSDPREYEQTDFDPARVMEAGRVTFADLPPEEMDLHEVMEENQQLKKLLTERRRQKRPSYVPRKLNLNEYKTRKLYIDSMLRDALWQEGVNWKNDVLIQGMPNENGVGCVDYVLYGSGGKPIALIEARRAGSEAVLGRQQAKLYADILEKQYGFRPAVYLSNGADTLFFLTPEDQEHAVEGFHSQQDLERMFSIRAKRRKLDRVSVRKQIADRYYQKDAVRAVCRALDSDKKRHVRVVMAPGTGKTRVIIALAEVLRYHKWLGHVLCLTENESLAKQMQRAFQQLLPDMPVVNLCEEQENASRACVIATYRVMAECIDGVQDEKGKIFTSGHFDLIVLDEAADVLSGGWQCLLQYFDSPVVCFTAFTGAVSALHDRRFSFLGSEVYRYSWDRAVRDHFLVPCDMEGSVLQHAVCDVEYEKLSDEDKREYEQLFGRDGDVPASISFEEAGRRWINLDSIREALHLLMDKGIYPKPNGPIGKTVIFAQSFWYAEKIREVFYQEYPHLAGQAEVVDRNVPYVQTLMDDFSAPNGKMRIAISTGMLDGGIDVPEIVNLVFLRRLSGKSRFYQMLGRGARPCPGLMNGQDKTCFRVFDLVGNQVRIGNIRDLMDDWLPAEGRILQLRAKLVYALQQSGCQTEALQEMRNALIDGITTTVRELDRDSWQVKMHLDQADAYADKARFHTLTQADADVICGQLAPLVGISAESEKALQFDMLMYSMMLCMLEKQPWQQHMHKLSALAAACRNIGHLPEAIARQDALVRAQKGWEGRTEDAADMEKVRVQLRELMHLLPADDRPLVTDFDDRIIKNIQA